MSLSHTVQSKRRAKRQGQAHTHHIGHTNIPSIHFLLNPLLLQNLL